MAQDWMYIPNTVLDDEQRGNAARQWADGARKDLAQQWVDAQGAPTPPLAPAQPPTRDDWATQAAPPASSPDLAAGVPEPAANTPLGAVSSPLAAPPAASNPLPPMTDTPTLQAPLPPVTDTPTLAAPSAIRGQDFTPNEFKDSSLSWDEASAACGPAAAIAFARAYGRNPTLREAVDLAKKVGFTTSGGMNGVGNQKRLLDSMGVPSTLGGGDWAAIQKATSSGQMVTISTPLHYFTATDYDPSTGKYYVGTSGMIWADQSKNSPWLTRAQIESYGQGPANGALYLNPGDAAPVTSGGPAATAPGPGDAGGSAAGGAPYTPSATPSLSRPSRPSSNILQDAVDTVGGVVQGATQAVSQIPGNIHDLISESMTRVLKPDELNRLSEYFRQQAPDTSAGSVPAPTPGGMLGSLAAPANGQASDLSKVIPQVASAADQVGGPVSSGNLRGIVNKLVTGANDSAGNLVGATTALDPNVIQPNAADLTKQQQADQTQTNQYAQARGLASGLAQTLTPEELIARAATTGAGSLAKSAEAAKPFLADESGHLQIGGGGVPVPPTGAAQPAPSLGQQVVERTQKMFEAQDQKPSLIDRVKGGLANIPGWVEQFSADALAPLNRLGGDVEQSAALFKGANGAAVQRVKDELAPALALLKDDSGKDLLPSLNTYRKLQVDAERIAAAGPRLASAGVNTVTDAQAGLQYLEQSLGARQFARVKAADQQVQQILDRLLQEKVASGMVKQSVANDLTTLYPHYNPVRMLEAVEDGSLASGKSLSQNSALIQRLTEGGAAGDTETPIRSAIRAMVQGHVAIQRNNAARDIADQVLAQGLGAKVPSIRLQTGPQVGGPSGLVPLSTTGKMATIITKKTGDIPGTFSYMKDGVRQVIDVSDHPEIERAVKSLDEQSLGIFSRVAQKLNAPLRAGATTLSAAFIPKNAIGDLITTFVVEGMDAVKRIPSGYYQAITDGPSLRAMVRAGGGMSGYMMRNPADLEKAVAEAGGAVIKNPGDWARVLRDAAMLPINAIHRVGEVVELAPRIATFESRLAKGQSTEQAALAARRVTIDFARSGQGIKVANAWVAFLNARIQGTLQVARSTGFNKPGTILQPTKQQLSARMRLGAVTSLAASTYLWNRQFPEELADIPDYEKDQGAVVIFGPGVKNDNGVGFKSIPHVTIPLREWSLGFSPLQHAFAAADKADPRSWDQFASSWTGTVNPISGDSSAGVIGSALPAPLRLMIESQMNQRFYSGAPVVSKKFEGTPPEEQFDEHTGGVSKAIAQFSANSSLKDVPILGGMTRSPKGIDFGLQEMFGGAGRMAGGNVNPASGLLREQGGQTEQNMYSKLGSQQSAMIDSVGRIVKSSKEYQAGTRDEQLQMLRAADAMLTSTLKKQIGIPDTTADLGLPPKYRGVSDPVQQRAIDDALSVYNKWNSDRKNNPHPTLEEQRLALRYIHPNMINPGYSREVKSRQTDGNQIDEQVRQYAESAR